MSRRHGYRAPAGQAECMERRMSRDEALFLLGSWHAILILAVYWLLQQLAGPPVRGAISAEAAVRIALGVVSLWLLSLATTRLAYGPALDAGRLDAETAARSGGWGMVGGAAMGVVVLALISVDASHLTGLQPSGLVLFFLACLFAAPIGLAVGWLSGLLAFAIDYAGCALLGCVFASRTSPRKEST